MRDKFNFKFKTGDANLVKPGEYYLELNADNSIKALKKREDNGTLSDILVDQAAVTAAEEDAVDDFKDTLEVGTATIDVTTVENGKITVNPGTGKGGFSKFEITVTGVE